MKTIALRILIISAAISSHAVAQVAKQISSLPAIITKPGRYVLNKDLVLKKVADAAITITVDDVRLDLGGHVITNGLPAGTDVTGILAQGHGGILVLNGTVRKYKTGIRLNGFQSPASGVSVENVRVDASESLGIQVLGLIGSVKHCVVSNTGNTQASSAVGMSFDLGFATVIDNDVLATLAGTGQQAEGIHCGAQAAVFENNRVLNDPSSHASIGMFFAFPANYLVENNRIAGFTNGILFTNAGTPKFRNNFTTDCTNPYVSGTDAGNNK